MPPQWEWALLPRYCTATRLCRQTTVLDGALELLEITRRLCAGVRA